MGYDPKLNDAESFGLNLGLARQILTHDCDDKTLRAKAEAIVVKPLEQLFTQEDFGEMGVDAFCGYCRSWIFLPATAYTQDQIRERILTLIENGWNAILPSGRNINRGRPTSSVRATTRRIPG